jgi:hypothetical protein
MQAKETGRFRRVVKRLRPNQKADLDQAVRDLLANPLLGEQKRGDLAWVRVYKFRLVGQLALLAYELRQEEGLIVLHAVGSHENFYRELKSN